MALVASVLVGGSLAAQAQPNRPQQQGGRNNPAPPKPKANEPEWAAPETIHPSMNIDKPLMTAEEAEEMRRSVLNNYQRVVRSGELDNAAKELIEKGVKYRVYSMTLKDKRQEIGPIRIEIDRDLRNAASIGTRKPDEIRTVRRFLVNEFANRAAELLDNQFYVRLTAVELLASLDLMEYDQRKGTPLEAYVPASKPLLEVVQDPDQPDAVKLAAVNGLTRILWVGTPNEVTNSLRETIADAAAKELARADADPWYQKRLCLCLVATGVEKNRDGEAFVAQVLASALADANRPWLVRTEAAKSLGRITIPSGVDVDLIAHEIVKVAHAMAKDYNANQKAKNWKLYFLNVYLAFQPEDADEKALKWGLLSTPGASAKVKDAYQQVLGIVQPVLSDSAIPPDALQQASDWLAQNKPADNRLAPNLPPLGGTPTQPVSTGSN